MPESKRLNTYLTDEELQRRGNVKDWLALWSERLELEKYLEKLKLSRSDLKTPRKELDQLIDATMIKISALTGQISQLERTGTVSCPFCKAIDLKPNAIRIPPGAEGPQAGNTVAFLSCLNGHHFIILPFYEAGLAAGFELVLTGEEKEEMLKTKPPTVH